MTRPAIPARMRALRLTAWGTAPQLVDVEVPEPAGTEVLVRVEASGLCQSDLHIIDAAPGQLPYSLPFTLGHEVAGTVVAAGDLAPPGQVGRPVVVHGVWGCGSCRNCARGRDSYCLELVGGPVGGGTGRDGGLADYVLVPDERHLVDNPALPATLAAPLTDAGLTAYHAVSRHLPLLEAGTALVVGVGGLGHLALQLIRAHTDAVVVAVDNRPGARSLAVDLGAHGAAATVEEGAEVLTGLGRGRGADVVLDFVGTPDTTEALAQVVAPGGRIVLVGSGGGTLEAAKGRGLPNGWSVTAPFWGHRADLEAVIGLGAAGVVEATTRTYALDDALSGLADLRGGRVQGRAVVVP